MIMGYPPQNLQQIYVTPNQMRPNPMVGAGGGGMPGVQATAQIMINSTSEGTEGQQVQTQKQIVILIFQNTPDVQENIKMASELSEQGNTDQALSLLT